MDIAYIADFRAIRPYQWRLKSAMRLLKLLLPTLERSTYPPGQQLPKDQERAPAIAP
ncbi:MAG: hypothetical protein MJA27_14880 [Pseudanabaenales cyanobacterium]|nr:hypothetical protein [Pseudanabaenales cyanobacterium]